MTPNVRGHFIVETESTGRAKRTLDTLVWLPQFSARGADAFDRVQILREYLASINPPVCAINLWVPIHLVDTAEWLARAGIPCSPAAISEPNEEVRQAFKDSCPDGMKEAASTALSCHADVIVVGDPNWLPYFQEFDNLSLLIADTGVFLRQCEIFVRGHEVPWSFAYMVWSEPWTAFYVLSEAATFRDGLRFLELAHKEGLDPATQETARMLIHNRLPNLCFTRDRLLFYDMQQAAAKRAKWQRQDFAFEVGYFLNFYYLLIYGGFDHLAAIVNGALKLGLPEKQVGATYEPFLNALSRKAPEIHALFTDASVVEFIQRIGALRHFTAHRGSIMPGKLYEKPDKEATPEELDAEIARLRLDKDLAYLPEGPIRDWARDLLRFKVNLSKHKEIAEGVVLIEVRGERAFISPMADIEWNFQKLHEFLTRVLDACAKRI